jgi:thiol-disulfide isomerase/thioredoxin
VTPSVRRAAIALAAVFALATSPTRAEPSSTWIRTLSRASGDDLAALFRAELADAAKRQGPVIVMFTADWCTPCRSLKVLFETSEKVQRAAGKGRILLVDVDEWRGPAHRLIPGQNPDKLPLLVSVDSDGKARASCYGTELGLLTEDATAHNLARLFRGQTPDPPDYASSPDKEREAMREFALREKAAAPEGPALTVRLDPGGATATVRVDNHDARRRWFVVPLLPGDAIPDAPHATGFAELKFDEHVRATWLRVGGAHPFVAIPVAGNGSVSVRGLWLPGLSPGSTLRARVVDRLTVDGTPLEFQKKLPYALEVADAASTTLGTRPGPLDLRLVGDTPLEASVAAP